MNWLSGGWAGWRWEKARNEMVSILQHTPFHNCGCRIWEAVRNRNPLPCVAVNSSHLSAFLTILIYYMPNLPGSSSMIPRIQVQDLALRAFGPIWTKQLPCSTHSHQLSRQQREKSSWAGDFRREMLSPELSQRYCCLVYGRSSSQGENSCLI